MKKRLSKYAFIAVSMLACSAYTIADSGKSALPPADPPLHQYFYKLYAPKTQTSFKQFQLITQDVDKVVKENADLMVYGGAVATGGSLAKEVKSISKIPLLGNVVKAVNIAGGAIALTGTAGYLSYRDFQKGSVIKHKVYFRWTNPERLEYQVKIETWVEYKGKVVSAVKKSQYSKTL